MLGNTMTPSERAAFAVEWNEVTARLREAYGDRLYEIPITAEAGAIDLPKRSYVHRKDA